MNANSTLRVVDLFCGLGGFHSALRRLGHECVFACEIDSGLREIYELNHEMRPASDIRFAWKDIPEHDVLCAGFPCQPFSKAGSQKGFECSHSGDLFDYILKVIDRHSPKYLIFENVPNMLNHNGGETWTKMQDSLRVRGYDTDTKELSPHHFGVPQIRPRAIIVGVRGGLGDFQWPAPDTSASSDVHLSNILDTKPNDSHYLTDDYLEYLQVWEEFLTIIPKSAKMPSFPIWSMEFGANYPVERGTPHTYDQKSLASFKGMFGDSLKGMSKTAQIQSLPVYARSTTDTFPHWKSRFILQNRAFYQEHQGKLKQWLPKVRRFSPSFQKFEWNWQAGSRTIWDKVVQFRASGIRVKNPATAPSLVALTTSQIPVIAWEKRYMTMRECARLQSMSDLNSLPESKTRAFKALGNAVNVDVIEKVAANLFAASNLPKSNASMPNNPRAFSNRLDEDAPKISIVV